MAKVKQLSAFLKNKPGALAEMCSALADAQVNIIALSVLENVEQGIVRLVVDKPDVAGKVLKQKAIPFLLSDVLMVKLVNKRGILAQVAQKLAAKKVNINYIYGSTGAGRGQTFIVLSVDKGAAAARLLAGL